MAPSHFSRMTAIGLSYRRRSLRPVSHTSQEMKRLLWLAPSPSVQRSRNFRPARGPAPGSPRPGPWWPRAARRTPRLRRAETPLPAGAGHLKSLPSRWLAVADGEARAARRAARGSAAGSRPAILAPWNSAPAPPSAARSPCWASGASCSRAGRRASATARSPRPSTAATRTSMSRRSTATARSGWARPSNPSAAASCSTARRSNAADPPPPPSWRTRSPSCGPTTSTSTSCTP